MPKARSGPTYTREQIRRAADNLVRKGLAIKRLDPERGIVYVAIEFATDEELIAARARKSVAGSEPPPTH